MENKVAIEELLIRTGREGVENLLDYMGKQGFYTAPCSGQYHLCKEGGLAEHSLNVNRIMTNIAWGLQWRDTEEKSISITIVSLLHDLGKMGHHNKPNYVPNMIKDKKDKDIYVQSKAKPYETNKDLAAVPHEVESIAIAEKFIELTEEEEFAILMHNGLYGPFKYELNGKERPLQLLLHFADMWCSRVGEKEGE